MNMKSLINGVLALGIIACSIVKNVRPNTRVAIIGTFHGSMKRMKIYTPEKLHELLAAAHADVLAVEIRPQDFEAETASNNPWDMNEIVLPFAKSANIPLEPIDWWPDDMRLKGDQYLREIGKTSEGRKKLSAVEDEWHPHAQNFPNFIEATPEYVHSSLFAEREVKYRSELTRILGEGPQNLYWQTRSEKMNQNLDRVLKNFPGRKIVVVVGAYHRPYIEKFLRSVNNVTLEPLFP
jgi:hypothetical protein